MKKVLPILLVAAMAAPLWAAVEITATDLGDGQIQLEYTCTAGEVVRGIALKVTAGDGDGVDGVINDFAEPASPVVNAYIDYYTTTGYDLLTQGLDDRGNAHPIADPAGPGPLSLPANEAVYCAGFLDELGGQAGMPASGVLGTFTVADGSDADGEVCVTIAEDGLRGGVVGDSVTEVTMPAEICVTLAEPECVKETAPFYADWVAFGKPDCWCYQRNCRGDINGTREGNAVTGYIWVYTQDLPTFLAAYGVKEAPKGPGIMSVTDGICADLNRTREGNAVTGYIRVYTQDLPIFLASYGVKEPTKGPGVAVCDMTNYNFWTN